jgi:putative membrane protein
MTTHRFFWIINIFYIVIWSYLAIGVLDRNTWLLENVLVIVTLIFCVQQYVRGNLSKTSYLLIFLFMVLHAVGAHYTYSEVPIGFTFKEYFDLTRNHYDRLAHFAFGLLWFYPFRQLLETRTSMPKKYLSIFTVLLIVALSSMFELIEWGAAVITAPEIGAAYLGSQGDIWDAQKDHALCSLGAIAAWMWMKAICKWLPKR